MVIFTPKVFERSFNGGKKRSQDLLPFKPEAKIMTVDPENAEFRRGGLYQIGKVILIQLSFNLFFKLRARYSWKLRSCDLLNV